MNRFGKYLKKNAPSILTTIGVLGSIASIVLAVKATPKAIEVCEKMKAENDNPKPIDYVKSAWKFYIPSIATEILSAFVIFGANHVNIKRTAGALAAYTLSEANLADFKTAAKKVVGEDKVKEIDDAVEHTNAKKTLEKGVFSLAKGENLYLDTITGQFFKSNLEPVEIKDRIVDLNLQMVDEMNVTVNDYVDAIGAQHSAIGDYIGWDIDNGKIDVYMGSGMGPNYQTYTIIRHRNRPRAL